MFKKIQPPSARLSGLLASALIILLTGCRTLPPLPAADLSRPGWSIQQGQAIWRSNSEAPEIAGEILIASRRDGSSLVQFTKTPFPLVIARTTPNAWQIESPVENRRFARKGKPPARLPWFHLPRLVGDPTVSAPFPWKSRVSPDMWRLENVQTGESIEGFVEPAAATAAPSLVPTP